MNLNQNIILKNGKNSHFKYKEFIKSDTALRYGINNNPVMWQWKNIEVLVQKILEPIRLEFGRVRITSGFRSEKLCLKIGSSIYSNHTRGEAADFETLEESNYLKVMNWIRKYLMYRELIAEYFPDGWIHVSHRFPNGNIQKLKLKDKDYNYQLVTMDELNQLYGFKVDKSFEI